MKNKLPISLLVMSLSCAFPLATYATNTENEEEAFNMELSENEVKTIQENCETIGLGSELEGEALATFVSECFADTTMVIDEGTALTEEDQAIPVLEDETLIIEGDEPTAENAS